MAAQAQGIRGAKLGGWNEVAEVQCGGAERVRGDGGMTVEQRSLQVKSSCGSHYRQNRRRVTEVDDRLMVTRGQGGGDKLGHWD